MIQGDSITQRALDAIMEQLGGMAEVAMMQAEGFDAPPASLLDFVENELESPLWEMQREIIRSIEEHPRTAVRSCHAAGKSHLASRAALAFVENHKNSIVVTTAPTSRQVRGVIWRNMRAAYQKARTKMRGRMLTDRYEIGPDWYAMGFKGSDTNSDAVQGFHAEHILVIVDEAAGVAESVLEAIEAILTGTGAKLLMIGNPTSMSGTFRRAFHEDAHLYNQITISAYDTPNFTKYGITREDMMLGAWRQKVTGPMPYPALIDPGWVDRQIQRHGADAPFVQSRVDAVFPTDADDVLIALTDIEVAMENSTAPDPLHSKYVGIDVARSGSDETVVCFRQGPAETHMDAWQGFDLMESVGKITHLLSERGYEDAELRVDVVGLGAGLADRLRELGYKVVDVNVSQSSSDKTSWRNFRNEAWWQLKELYREQLIWPAPGHEFDPQMISQLVDIRTKYGSIYTKPEIENKDDYKKRTNGRSPDRAEAQLLAYCTLPPPERKKKRKKPSAAITPAGRAQGWSRILPGSEKAYR